MNAINPWLLMCGLRANLIGSARRRVHAASTHGITTSAAAKRRDGRESVMRPPWGVERSGANRVYLAGPPIRMQASRAPSPLIEALPRAGYREQAPNPEPPSRMLVYLNGDFQQKKEA